MPGAPDAIGAPLTTLVRLRSSLCSALACLARGLVIQGSTIDRMATALESIDTAPGPGSWRSTAHQIRGATHADDLLTEIAVALIKLDGHFPFLAPIWTWHKGAGFARGDKAAQPLRRVALACPLCRELGRGLLLVAEIEPAPPLTHVVDLQGACEHAGAFGQLDALTIEDEWRLIRAALDAADEA